MTLWRVGPTSSGGLRSRTNKICRYNTIGLHPVRHCTCGVLRCTRHRMEGPHYDTTKGGSKLLSAPRFAKLFDKSYRTVSMITTFVENTESVARYYRAPRLRRMEYSNKYSVFLQACNRGTCLRTSLLHNNNMFGRLRTEKKFLTPIHELGLHVLCVSVIRIHDDRLAWTRNRTGDFQKCPRPIRNALLYTYFLFVCTGNDTLPHWTEPFRTCFTWRLLIITDINPA